MVLTKNSKTAPYIFGTAHHVGPDPVFNNKTLLSIILQSKFIVLEIDTIEVKKPSHKLSQVKTIGLDKLITQEDYIIVKEAYLKYTGLNIDDDKFYSPLVISSAIRNGKEKSEKHVKQMESAFYTICKDRRIPIKGLETREYRNTLFMSFPIEEQAKMLMYDLNELLIDKAAEEYRICFEENDLNCLCNLDDLNHYTRPGDTTLVMNRNLFWINNIKNYIEQGASFIAIGAAHLCGDYGILALLRKEGYMIVPILTE